MQDQVFLGVWSPADLIAHLIGWDYTNAQAIVEIQAGKLPAFYTQHDRDWKRYNASLVAHYKNPDPILLVAAAEESQRELIERLGRLSGEQIEADYGVRTGRYKVTIARLLNAELSDEVKHLDEIKNFQEAGIPDHSQ